MVQPIKDGIVRIAYQHTEYYEDQTIGSGDSTTFSDGTAKIHVFGDLRIRLQAETLVPEKGWFGSPRYSRLVELEAAKLPQRLDLAINP
jgi:hypothetical protein